MADPQLVGLIRDPDFIALSPSQQRDALSRATGDNSFSSLSDGDTLMFLNRARSSQPTQFEQARPGANMSTGQHIWDFIKSTAGNLIPSGGQNPYPGMGIEQKVAASDAAYQQAQARKAAGYGPLYRAAATIAPLAMVNPAGAEEAAAQARTGAVLGNTVGPPAAAVGIGKVIPAAVEKTGQAMADKAPRLYKTALKPSTTLSPSETGKIIDTALTNEIPVSPAGVEKIHALISDLNNKIADTIETKGAGVEINPKNVASRMGQTKSVFANQVNPVSDLASLQAAKTEFLNKHTQIAPYTKIALSDEGGFAPVGQGEVRTLQPIPAAEAQAEKIGTYRQLKDKSYGELKGASIEAQKSLARGLKEELANAIPELKGLNAKESSLLHLQPVLEKAVNRITNHQLIGIGTPAVAMGTEAVTGSMKAAGVAAMLKAVIDQPEVKSRLAIQMSKAKGMTIPKAQAKLGVYSYALSQLAGKTNNPPASDQSASQQLAPQKQ